MSCEVYRELATAYFALAERVIDKYVADGRLTELMHDGKEKNK